MFHQLILPSTLGHPSPVHIDDEKIRLLHFYLGVLFSPAIIFFALTGAFQTFRWQENGSAGAATPVLATMASVHKNRSLGGERPARPGNEGRQATKSGSNDSSAHNENAESLKPATEGEGSVTGRQASEKEAKAGDPFARRGPSPLPLKIYVFFMSLGLITTTLLGIYMAFKYNRDKRAIWALLIIGTILPIGLLFI